MCCADVHTPSAVLFWQINFMWKNKILNMINEIYKYCSGYPNIPPIVELSKNKEM